VPKSTDPPNQDHEEDDLRSRTDARMERLAREDLLMRLSDALVSSSPAALAKLGLPESLFDAIRDTQSVRVGSARNRAIRLVRAALRSEDFDAIREKLTAVNGKEISTARHRKHGRR
jgi:ribosomal 50S subunit-associated protein YjgA (DUF615 family)